MEIDKKTGFIHGKFGKKIEEFIRLRIEAI